MTKLQDGTAYDSPKVPVVSTALPSWYRNLPQAMVGRDVVLEAPPRPGPIPGWEDPGRNPLPSDGQMILSWSGRTEAPVPCTLELQCRWADGNGFTGGIAVFPPIMAALMAGQNARLNGIPVEPGFVFNPDPHDAGYFEIQYGAGGAQQSIVVDLRDQAIDLPPVNWVRVSAYRYPGGADRGTYDPPTTLRYPIRVTAGLHGGASQQAEGDPICSAGRFRIGEVNLPIRTWVPAHGTGYLYGIASDDAAAVVTVEGAILTRSATASGGAGAQFFPFWGPGIPYVPTNPGAGGAQFVDAIVGGTPGQLAAVYIGSRIGV